MMTHTYDTHWHMYDIYSVLRCAQICPARGSTAIQKSKFQGRPQLKQRSGLRYARSAVSYCHTLPVPVALHNFTTDVQVHIIVGMEKDFVCAFFPRVVKDVDPQLLKALNLMYRNQQLNPKINK